MIETTPTNIGVTVRINIHGDEFAELELSLADLKALPAHTLGDIRLTCLSGAERGQIKSYRGALLRDVIDQIGLESADNRELKQMLIIAHAHDGYSAIFSWNELFNTTVGHAVLVVYEKDGETLGSTGTDFVLISANDISTAPRHVKGLRTIELRRV